MASAKAAALPGSRTASKSMVRVAIRSPRPWPGKQTDLAHPIALQKIHDFDHRFVSHILISRDDHGLILGLTLQGLDLLHQRVLAYASLRTAALAVAQKDAAVLRIVSSSGAAGG